jgi:predicted GIY-YIG superfamily endonuclease
LKVKFIAIPMTPPAWLYILKLQDNKYYVGTTHRNQPNLRLKEHQAGDGSAWTRKYSPVGGFHELIKLSDSWTKTRVLLEETNKVRELMAIHGIANVRGGSLCQVELSEQSVQELQREMRHANDQCQRCGRKGHFISDCFARTDASGSAIGSTSSNRSSGRKRPAVTTAAGRSNATDRVPKKNKKTKVMHHREHESYENEESDEEDRTGNCLRCGRLGHSFSSCYAKTTVNGEAIINYDFTHLSAIQGHDDDKNEGDDEEVEVSAFPEQHVNGLFEQQQNNGNYFQRGRTGHFDSDCCASSRTTIRGEEETSEDSQNDSQEDSSQEDSSQEDSEDSSQEDSEEESEEDSE